MQAFGATISGTSEGGEALIMIPFLIIACLQKRSQKSLALIPPTVSEAASKMNYFDLKLGKVFRKLVALIAPSILFIPFIYVNSRKLEICWSAHAQGLFFIDLVDRGWKRNHES